MIITLVNLIFFFLLMSWIYSEAKICCWTLFQRVFFFKWYERFLLAGTRNETEFIFQVAPQYLFLLFCGTCNLNLEHICGWCKLDCREQNKGHNILPTKKKSGNLSKHKIVVSWKRIKKYRHDEHTAKIAICIQITAHRKLFQLSHFFFFALKYIPSLFCMIQHKLFLTLRRNRFVVFWIFHGKRYSGYIYIYMNYILKKCSAPFWKRCEGKFIFPW